MKPLKLLQSIMHFAIMYAAAPEGAAAGGKFGALAAVVARDLNEIADLPDYGAPPPGVWKLYIKEFKPKEIGGKTALSATYTILECVELSDPADLESEQMPKLGGDNPEACFTESFFFHDPEKIEQTLSVMKKKFGHLGEHFGTTNLLEILDKLEGLTIVAKVTNRADKDDKTKIYAGTRDIALAAE